MHEQRHAAASPTSWVFNWRADGWGPGSFESETRTFGEGVTVRCVLQNITSTHPRHSHCIGCKIEGPSVCRVHVTFSILDKHDKALLRVFEMGTARAPREIDLTGDDLRGKFFTPTSDQAQSVRADGSIRLRAEVSLFLN